MVSENNRTPRAELYNKANGVIPNFVTLDKIHQFNAIMSDKTPEIIQALGSYLNKVMC